MVEYVTKEEFKEQTIVFCKDIDTLKDSRFNMTIDMALLGEKLQVIQANTAAMNEKLDKLTDTRHNDHLVVPLSKYEKIKEQVIMLLIGAFAGYLISQMLPFLG